MQSLKLLHRKFASVCLFLSVTNQQKMDVLLIFQLFGCPQNRWDIVCKSQHTGVDHHKFIFDPPLSSQYTAPCSWIEHLDIHTIFIFLSFNATAGFIACHFRTFFKKAGTTTVKDTIQHIYYFKKSRTLMMGISRKLPISRRSLSPLTTASTPAATAQERKMSSPGSRQAPRISSRISTTSK